MSISRDLFLAILSMDAYNRGYGAGVGDGDETGQVGNAFIVNPSSVGRTQPILDQWQTAGFYAIAYGTEYGTVISYRGTDDYSLFSDDSDVWTGWVIGAGVLGTQARLAVEFYEQVEQANPDKKIIVTGHSLGGGLAGLVASLNGLEAVIYDNMP